jgi:UDP-N-acetylmuramoyl-L-alanyl-D-glutamate--2,6-diaminopimelate ligase
MFRDVVKKLIPRQLFKKIEPYGHLIEAILANIRYGFPARGLKVIGVTGTDGKTTTSTMIYTMLNDAGIKTGLMTTIQFGVPGSLRDNTEHMTTLTSFSLMQKIKLLRAEGIDWLVLETTSHALAQNRMWGVPFSIGVFTNLSNEHLDYHGTFEAYREAKLRLFKKVNRNKKGLRVGITNIDDESGEIFASMVARPVRYGINDGYLKAKDIYEAPQGSQFVARYADHELHVNVNLPGEFNIYNALAAIGVGLILEVDDHAIEHGIESLTGVPGRLTTVEAGQDFNVYVDFGHTPNAFINIFKVLRPLTKGRLIAVFGATGRRDKTKRPVMGEIAAEQCDLVIITQDDDRDEDGESIINQIAKGAQGAGKVLAKDLWLIHDRRDAIKKAVALAQPGDTLVLLGKGHEKTLLDATGEHEWSDVGEVRKAIERVSRR